MDEKLLEAVRGKIKYRGSTGYENELFAHIDAQAERIREVEAVRDTWKGWYAAAHERVRRETAEAIAWSVADLQRVVDDLDVVWRGEVTKICRAHGAVGVGGET